MVWVDTQLCCFTDHVQMRRFSSFVINTFQVLLSFMFSSAKVLVLKHQHSLASCFVLNVTGERCHKGRKTLSKVFEGEKDGIGNKICHL